MHSFYSSDTENLSIDWKCTSKAHMMLVQLVFFLMVWLSFECVGWSGYLSSESGLRWRVQWSSDGRRRRSIDPTSSCKQRSQTQEGEKGAWWVIITQCFVCEKMCMFRALVDSLCFFSGRWSDIFSSHKHYNELLVIIVLFLLMIFRWVLIHTLLLLICF